MLLLHNEKNMLQFPGGTTLPKLTATKRLQGDLS